MRDIHACMWTRGADSTAHLLRTPTLILEAELTPPPAFVLPLSPAPAAAVVCFRVAAITCNTASSESVKLSTRLRTVTFWFRFGMLFAGFHRPRKRDAAAGVPLSLLLDTAQFSCVLHMKFCTFDSSTKPRDGREAAVPHNSTHL